MKKFALLALAALVAAGCDLDPCTSPEVRAAWVAGAGPAGVLAVLALSCPHPAPQPIAAVQTAGLTEQPAPDMGTVPDLGQVLDLSPPPDLTPSDHDADGVPDVSDRCPTTPAGSSPDSSRRGCPSPSYYTVEGTTLAAESGSWSLSSNVWTSAPLVNWATYRPVPSTLVMRVELAQTAPADLTVTEFSWSGLLDLGVPTTQPECLPLKSGGLFDFPANPEDPTVHTCVPRSMQALLYDEKGNFLSGGAECAPIQGLHLVNCKMQLGVKAPIPAGSTYFFVKFLAVGAVKLSEVRVLGKVQVTLH